MHTQEQGAKPWPSIIVSRRWPYTKYAKPTRQCQRFKGKIIFCHYIRDSDYTSPENTRRLNNVDLILVQSRRRWTSIKSTLVQRLAFAGMLSDERSFDVLLMITSDISFTQIMLAALTRLSWLRNGCACRLSPLWDVPDNISFNLCGCREYA